MKDRKEKDKLNDDLLDQVSGGSHELDTPPDCDFKGCPYGTPCLHGLPCPNRPRSILTPIPENYKPTLS